MNEHEERLIAIRCDLERTAQDLKPVIAYLTGKHEGVTHSGSDANIKNVIYSDAYKAWSRVNALIEDLKDE